MSLLTRYGWNSTKCIPWLVILVILYAVPFTMDMAPDRDIYLMGVPFLGLYGTIILTVLALAASIGYGMSCVHEAMVMRCGVFGCDDKDEHLLFPPDFPENEKLRYKAAMKGVPRDFTTWHPWSEYNKKLQVLNSSLHDPEFKTPPMPQEYYTKLDELEQIRQKRLNEYATGVHKTGLEGLEF